MGLVFLFLATAAVVSLTSDVARADGSGDGAGDGTKDDGLGAHSRWMGAFWGVELKGSLDFRLKDGEAGGGLGLGLRAATLLSLIDAELSALVSPFDRHTRTRVAFELRLHPLFVRMLQRDLGSRLLAGLHVAVGVGLDHLDWGEGDEAAFAFAFGVGADIPLTTPSRGEPSLWLGLGWRMRFAGFDHAPRGLGDGDEHQVLVQLGVRFHDIGFMRLPRPPELDDRDR
ncbi:MAG TPA: hypothetical protein PK095_05445 [Myxococcota bacterium]|nr:hypothetical protein [Myxococcota bacterium]